MKKISIALVLMAFMMSVIPASAQLKFGVTAGLNVSKLSTSNIAGNFKNSNRAGWFLGPKVYFTVPIIGIGVDGALVYSERNIALTEEESKTQRSIEIPINARYTLGLSSLASVYVATGPQFGFNVGNTKWAGLPMVETKKSIVSWNVGAGVRVLSHLEVGVGYNFQLNKNLITSPLLSSIESLTNIEIDNKSTMRNNSWQVQVTYLF